MTKFLQIVSLILAVQWLANGTPLFQGVSFQRGFEINFKPLPRKPITFLKEKWSPFGVFGRKHSIQKRHSGSGDAVGEAAPVAAPLSGVPEPRPAAPVFEHVEETGNLHTSPIIPLPPRPLIPMLITSPVPPVSPIQSPLISPGPPLVASPPPPPMPVSVIVTPVPPVPPPSIPPQVVSIPPKQPVISNVQQPPLRLEGSLPDVSSNMVVPPPPGLFTDVSRPEPVGEFVNGVQPIPPPLAVEEKVTPPLETNSIKPEPPKNYIVINDNALVRGSKFALYFGSMFLQLVAQFMSNARATFDQMTNGTPVYNN